MRVEGVGWRAGDQNYFISLRLKNMYSVSRGTHRHPITPTISGYFYHFVSSLILQTFEKKLWPITKIMSSCRGFFPTTVV